MIDRGVRKSKSSILKEYGAGEPRDRMTGRDLPDRGRKLAVLGP
jgi:hypothetical protein